MEIQRITHRIRKEIKNELEKRNMSQREYAKQIQLNESTLSNYVTGNREIPYQLLAQFTKALDLDLNYIFDSNKDKRSQTLTEQEELFVMSLRKLSEQERDEIYSGLIALLKSKTI